MTEAFDVPVAAATTSPEAACPGLPNGDSWKRMTLPGSLTSRYAPELYCELQAARGQSIVIDVSAVRQVGTLCLQVLASAHRTWTSDGLGFQMSDHPGSLSRHWQIFGLPIGDPVECADQ